MKFRPSKKLTKEQSAARILAVFAENPGTLFTLREVMARTALGRGQVKRGERYLKEYLNDHREDMPDWTLHITFGSTSSEHGLIANSDASFLDAVHRLKYMSARAVSELDYREQQIARVPDATVAKLLRRGITYQRAAREAFADAYERLTGK